MRERLAALTSLIIVGSAALAVLTSGTSLDIPQDCAMRIEPESRTVHVVSSDGCELAITSRKHNGDAVELGIATIGNPVAVSEDVWGELATITSTQHVPTHK